MHIDWMIFATIAAPLIALFVGAWVNRRFENRPFLVAYFGHVSAFTHKPASGQLITIHTHSVVLRNSGRRAATNVRLNHVVLPDFNIYPAIVHQVQVLPNGSSDILIPTLVPSEEITISYLYFPPVTVSQVNAGIKCDQGFAHPIPVLLQRQYPRWLNRITASLIIIGLISVLYFLYYIAAIMMR